MRIHILASMALAAALPLSAQQAAPAARPALINDTTMHTVDSPLVRAAKRTLAARRNASQSSWVVDDQFILRTTGHISQSRNGKGNLYSDQSSTAPGSVAMGTTGPGADPMERARKTQEMQQEHARAVESLADPYSGDVDQDQAIKQILDTPGSVSQPTAVPNFVPPVPIQPPQ